MTPQRHRNATRPTTEVPNLPTAKPRCSIATRTPPHTTTAGTRRSYVSHLIEAGYDARFVQEQAGHDHASTTSIYTKSWELHQTGEKPQVTRSTWQRGGVSSRWVTAV
ncbi:MAG: tyrosine-type recombinase/integrase [Pseudonocardiaceae bacterium]